MKSPKSWSRKHKIVSVLFLFLVGALGVAVILLVRWASQPVVQTINVQSSPTTAVVETGKLQTITTPYFSTEVPEALRVQKTENTTNPALVQISVFESKNGGRQLGITSNVLPAEGVKGVADYNYRAKKTDIYKQSTLPTAPAGSVTFESVTGQREIATFIKHESRYASVVVTGTVSTREQLLSLHDQVLSAWNWE
jgi:hypothetical protein